MLLVWFIGSFFLMEFIAWSNHKYIMHGFLWKWHKDHHINDLKKSNINEVHYSGFEKNDLFSMFYAIPSMFLIILGFAFHLHELVAIGFGFTLYGITYFFVHDVIIHQRFHIPFLQTSHNFYITALKRAHLAHHRPRNATDFDNFGLLIFQTRFFKE